MNHIGPLCLIFLSLFLNACGSRDQAASLYNKGNELFAKREFKKALAMYRNALDEDGSFANARLMIAKIHYYEKRFPDALACLDEILADDPDHVGALYWKARTTVISNGTKDKDAMEMLRRVIEVDGHHSHARSLLALLYEKNGRYRDAVFEYQHILAEEEALINARANAGILYRRLGLNDKAVEEIERASAIARLVGYTGDNLEIIRKELKK